MKNPEMVRFVTDPLQAKKMCMKSVRKLSLVIKYVPDRYKSKVMCD